MHPKLHRFDRREKPESDEGKGFLNFLSSYFTFLFFFLATVISSSIFVSVRFQSQFSARKELVTGGGAMEEEVRVAKKEGNMSLGLA